MATISRELNRDLIIKDGFLKHREPGLVTRWRHRYVVFRTSTAGRFIFTVYRDQPAVPANEQTEVPIEEFGGLECTMKLDGEKHVFAIITMGMTECFAVDNQETLQEWCTVLTEYLGQELVMNVEVPYKQKSLKSGKAQMRVRNTGFTITSLDAPPRCMGSWQILHIRKFGGSDSFRFETGSKCPSGEFLYVIKAENVRKIKQVFSDLSHHKPIFQNDRTGRRMTREHKILQQYKDRQQVGPRLSLQHNTTPPNIHMFKKQETDQSRPRSNALVTENDNQYSELVTATGGRMKTSPSASDIPNYYNLPQGGMDATIDYKRKANSLSAAISHGDNVYYNREAIDLQVRMNAGNRQNSDSDSDDDFVDVNRLRDDNINNTYYNLRDNPMLLRSKAKQTTESDRPVYENFTPKFKSDSPRTSERHSNPEEHNYSNFTVSRKDTSSTCSLDSSRSHDSATTNDENKRERNSTIIQKSSEKRERNSTLVDQSLELPNGSLVTKETLSNKNSFDSDDSDSFRRRTTSIVEHVMISADQNARSCEDLLSSENKIWRRDNSDGNHSDSEILNDSMRKRIVKESHRTSDDEDYQVPSIRSLKSPSKVNEYDHLELRDGESVDGEPDSVSLHLPTLPDESAIMKSFQNRKQKAHLYEDVDILDDDRQWSSSPESPSPIHKQQSYKRKVSITGRQHCYESVPRPQKSPSPPLQSSSETSVINKIRSGLTSPTRFSNSRAPLPLQHVGLGSSFEGHVPTPSVVNANRNSKKPVPTPRGPKDESSKATRESMYVNGSVIKEQINAMDKPELPPKPRKLSTPQYAEPSTTFRSTLLHHERFGSSDSHAERRKPGKLKPQMSLQEMLPNYAQIYVETQPIRPPVSKDKSKLSQSTAEKRNPATNYMQIDHFKTEQLQHIIEQRKQEKSLAVVQ